MKNVGASYVNIVAKIPTLTKELDHHYFAHKFNIKIANKADRELANTSIL